MWDNLLNSSLGRCLICFSVLDVQKWDRHSCNQLAAAAHCHCLAAVTSTLHLVSFLCLSTLSSPAEPHAKDWKTPHRGLMHCESVSQWSNVSRFDVLLFIVNLWYFKHVGKCSVAYNCKVIEVFVIRDLTTALCYYNSAWKWNKASRFCVCVWKLSVLQIYEVLLYYYYCLFVFYNRFQYSSNPTFVTDLTARFCPGSSRAARLCRPGRCQRAQSRIYWFVCNVSTGLWKYSKHWVFAINLFGFFLTFFFFFIFNSFWTSLSPQGCCCFPYQEGCAAAHRSWGWSSVSALQLGQSHVLYELPGSW